MIGRLILFFSYNKIYLITGVILLILSIMPTKERISSKNPIIFYLAVIIWIICFGYRFHTGQDVIHLFNDNNDEFISEVQTHKLESPFQKYYSNDTGRKLRDRDK